ncbi:MAG: translation initiation factor IF-2 [Candidatus Cloacimonetes bacterium]|nr:translation initiation factor IF-2 [Candidatus Cloacimonadota bacterium]
MSIRVHQLAKEFKISTAALRKHLGDMGFEVKSHMSPVSDEVVEKIRAKFKEEVAAVKQRQFDRKTIHKKIVLANRKKEEEKIEQEKAKKIVIKEKSEIPVFVEKQIKKAVPRTSKKVDKKKQSQAKFVSEKTPPNQPAVIPEKVFKKDDKEKEKSFEEKNKHLQAKLKSLKKSGRKKKFTPTELEEAEISRNIKKALSTSTKKKKYKKEDKEQSISELKLIVNEFTSVSELAKMMGVAATEIISKFFMIGQMVTINQRLDKESLEMICDEFNFNVEFKEEYGTEILEEKTPTESDAEFESRPPIVTVMGHVDHGKTAILDNIRSTNVIAGESGGITQHIGAYQVDYQGKKITFLDTPGHEAFAAMRARGANVTDIAVIVVAANESVKQQTVEAIDHAKAAGVVIIVAINKIDLKDANIDKTIADLMKKKVMLEGYGGEVLWTKCSAKTGEGIDDLLETIILSAEMQEITAPVDVSGKGIVIESMKDQRRGTIITVLLQEGKLKKSDSVICGATYGRIRKMEDERGNEITELNPSDVAIIYGLNDVPKAGDIINKVENEKTARQISAERTHIRKEREKYQIKTNLDNLFQKIKEHEMSEIKLIVKGDTDGSVEALCDSFQKLSTEDVVVNIIHKAVGGINEADVNLASASDALIIGFHVRANSVAKKSAEDEKVEIRIYQIIYEAIEDIKLSMQGLLAPEFKEKYLGTAMVKQVFKIKNVGTIAGVTVEKGIITNSGKVRLYRNDILVHEGELSSLKHYSEEVKQVKAGSECGIGIADYNDIKEGDLIENYIIEEIQRKL